MAAKVVFSHAAVVRLLAVITAAPGIPPPNIVLTGSDDHGCANLGAMGQNCRSYSAGDFGPVGSRRIQ